MHIYLSANPGAVDAGLFRKDSFVVNLAAKHGILLSQVAGIGDGRNDLPFLRLSGLGLVGSPANAVEQVTRCVRAHVNGVVLDGEGLEGFLDFYSMAARSGCRMVISDRDGVLLHGEIDPLALREVWLLSQRPDMPRLAILTGSSAQQNEEFLDVLLGRDGLASKSRALKRDVIVGTENGGVLVDPVTRAWALSEWAPAGALRERLLGEYRRSVVSAISAEILPRWNLRWAADASDRLDALHMPEKMTMVSVDLPKGWRGIDQKDALHELRCAVSAVMRRVAEQLGFEVDVAGVLQPQTCLGFE